MSANLISNKTLSNSVIPFKNSAGLIHTFTSSSDYIVPSWYYSLTAILIAGGGGGMSTLSAGVDLYTLAGAGGGAGSIAAFALSVKPGDKITGVIGAGAPAGSSPAGYPTLGGSTSIAINGATFISIPGGVGGQANIIGPNVSVAVDGAGSAGGCNSSQAEAPKSKGAGTLNSGFFTSMSSFATTGVFLSTVSINVLTLGGNSYGSNGGTGPATYFAAGGGGGIGRGSPGTNGIPTIGQYGHGGPAGTLLIPTLTGDPVPFFVCGGGAGYCGDTAGYGLGGSTVYNGTTYTVGGSSGNVTAGTPGAAGVINTGSGGGGAGSYNQTAAGAGGSGLIILIGQRSYPFSGKPI